MTPLLAAMSAWVTVAFPTISFLPDLEILSGFSATVFASESFIA